MLDPIIPKTLPSGEFQSLALESMDMLYRVALRLTGEPNAAEDLVQETYLRALRAWESFTLHDFGIRPWLVRILRNLHLSNIERRKLQPHAVDEQLLEQIADGKNDGGFISSGDPALLEGLDQRLSHALHALPRHYQVVLLLWAVDDLSYAEIACALGLPIGTVMSRLHRAKVRLGERLGGLATELRLLSSIA